MFVSVGLASSCAYTSGCVCVCVFCNILVHFCWSLTKDDLFVSRGATVNKQINDKERVAAAMENPHLREIVEQCVLDPD